MNPKSKRKHIVRNPNGTNVNLRFEKAVATMDIPEIRKKANSANANWLLANAWIYCANHPKLDAAMQAAKKLAN